MTHDPLWVGLCIWGGNSNNGSNTYYLKVDVHHYFASIDKAVLMEKI